MLPTVEREKKRERKRERYVLVAQFFDDVQGTPIQQKS